MVGQTKAGQQTFKATLGLRNLVVSGEVKPGDRLSELALSEKLGLSRTPIRAALLQLAQEGLLEPIPSGGYAVRRFSEKDVIDAIELRGVLEGTAVRLAAERGVPPNRMRQLHELVGELDDVVAAGPDRMDFDRYSELNTLFHDTISELSDSAILQRELERVMQLPFALPSAFLDSQANVPAFRATLVVAQAHHRAIAEAIDLHEGTRGEALAREHARLARQNLAHVLGDKSLAGQVPALALMEG